MMALNIHSSYMKIGTQEAAASTSPFTRESCVSAPSGRPLVSIIRYATDKNSRKAKQGCSFYSNASIFISHLAQASQPKESPPSRRSAIRLQPAIQATNTTKGHRGVVRTSIL